MAQPIIDQVLKDARDIIADRRRRLRDLEAVTADGCEILTRFPADELLVCGRIYTRGADFAELEARA